MIRDALLFEKLGSRYQVEHVGNLKRLQKKYKFLRGTRYEVGLLVQGGRLGANLGHTRDARATRNPKCLIFHPTPYAQSLKKGRKEKSFRLRVCTVFELVNSEIGTVNQISLNRKEEEVRGESTGKGISF